MNRLISILTLILVIPMFGQAQLPNKWDSGFTIRLSHSGSMSAQATARVVNDGWSSSICLGTDCIQGGTSAEMSIADKDIFLEAYDYLQQFALERRPK